MDEEQAATKSRQEVRDQAGRLPPPAQHQGIETGGQRQLHMSIRKCRDHCYCVSERCVQLAVNNSSVSSVCILPHNTIQCTEHVHYIKKYTLS